MAIPFDGYRRFELQLGNDVESRPSRWPRKTVVVYGVPPVASQLFFEGLADRINGDIDALSSAEYRCAVVADGVGSDPVSVSKGCVDMYKAAADIMGLSRRGAYLSNAVKGDIATIPWGTRSKFARRWLARDARKGQRVARRWRETEDSLQRIILAASLRQQLADTEQDTWQSRVASIATLQRRYVAEESKLLAHTVNGNSSNSVVVCSRDNARRVVKLLKSYGYRIHSNRRLEFPKRQEALANHDGEKTNRGEVDSSLRELPVKDFLSLLFADKDTDNIVVAYGGNEPCALGSVGFSGSLDGNCLRLDVLHAIDGTPLVRDGKALVPFTLYIDSEIRDEE